jgi:hypothetical protein
MQRRRRPGERAETAVGVLITQRSQVQILPPLPRESAGQRPSDAHPGAFAVGRPTGCTTPSPCLSTPSTTTRLRPTTSHTGSRSPGRRRTPPGVRRARPRRSPRTPDRAPTGVCGSVATTSPAASVRGLRRIARRCWSACHRSGDSRLVTSRRAIGGSYLRLGSPGSSARVANQGGRAVALCALRGPRQGVADVFFGGRRLKRIHLHAATDRQAMITMPLPVRSVGSVRVVVVGPKPVRIDGLAMLR